MLVSRVLCWESCMVLGSRVLCLGVLYCVGESCIVLGSRVSCLGVLYCVRESCIVFWESCIMSGSRVLCWGVVYYIGKSCRRWKPPTPQSSPHILHNELIDEL